MNTEVLKHFPIMENMTVKTVTQYLEHKKSIIIPVGVIEQHGYHLPLNTDALIATRLAARIGFETEVLVAPTMYQSFSGGGCPGTINISPATMSLVMSDMLISLASQGFRNFYIFLCHGGSENAVALDNALKMLLRNNTSFENAMIALMPVWKFDKDENGWKKGFKEGDWHAGWLETSLVQTLAPELVNMEDLELDGNEVLTKMLEHPDNYQLAEKIVDDEFVISRQRQKPEVKVGVMGDPSLASAEKGENIANSIISAVVEKINELESKADGIYKQVEYRPEPIILC